MQHIVKNCQNQCFLMSSDEYLPSIFALRHIGPGGLLLTNWIHFVEGFAPAAAAVTKVWRRFCGVYRSLEVIKCLRRSLALSMAINSGEIWRRRC